MDDIVSNRDLSLRFEGPGWTGKLQQMIAETAHFAPIVRNTNTNPLSGKPL
jgi:hypothetical protein